MRSILVTPNFLGMDGISRLSRQILHLLPRPAAVLSLHDPVADPVASTTQGPAGGPTGGSRAWGPAERLADLPTDLDKVLPEGGAGGSTARFLARAGRLALESDRETCIVCCHLHLAPVARAIAWRAWRGLGPARVRITYILCGIEAWVPVRPSERWALAAGRLVAISSHTAQRFKAANPDFAAMPVEICRPGLPARSNGRSPEASMGSLIASGPGALIVGRMARDEGYKGHEQLIDLWPRVQQRCQGARLWVVGDGDDRPRLEALARSRAVDGSIAFTGRIADGALGELYRTCRFFVLPSRDEGFGLVFLEAMREGKACIGARGAAEEIISHQSTGLIVDPARPDELYAALVRLFDDPATCDAFGEAGRTRFAAVFTDAQFRSRFAPLLSHEECEVTHAQVR